jgi:hypothetical protein
MNITAGPRLGCNEVLALTGGGGAYQADDTKQWCNLAVKVRPKRSLSW